MTVVKNKPWDNPSPKGIKVDGSRYSSREFMEALKKKCNNTSLEQVENAWNAMLVDLPQSRLDYIKNLKNNYQIFLLSNTNEIHIKAFRKNIGEEKWIAFSSLFDKMYLSHQIGVRKPNKEDFKII